MVLSSHNSYKRQTKRFISSKKLRVSVIGLGFVGLSIALVNSKKGFTTIGVDVNKEKIRNLKKGIPDFFEPGIENYLDYCLKSNLIKFTTNLEETLFNTDLTFVCVGTPPKNDGTIDLKYIKNAIRNIHKILKSKKKYHLLVIKSTVFPQTTKDVVLPVFSDLLKKGLVDVVMNPEFLREGYAIKDILEPHLIVIGGNSKHGGQILEKYYRNFYGKLPEIIHCDPTTAELIKYANNAFLATKISFINSIANICQNLPGVDVNVISKAIGKDRRIGPLFLNAGPGFGGSCLPKDLSALINFSKRYDNTDMLFSAVEKVNKTQPIKVLNLIKKINLLKPSKTISVLGLAFKKDTDDIRAATSIEIVKKLIKNKLIVKVHDPKAMDNFKKIFGNKIIYCQTVDECIKNSDCCLILTEWDSYKKLSPQKFKKLMKKPNIIDARRILDPKKFSKLNLQAIGLGN